MVNNSKKKEYYAILNGDRVEKPTIFSSWGDAHPRVTGLSPTPMYKSSFTIEQARKEMESWGVKDHDEVIKVGAGETTPVKKKHAYYAVANGNQIGIYKDWGGDDGCKNQTSEESNSCFKQFRTEAQAEAFIEDWKETVAELYRKAIKKALDEGFRPTNMEFKVESLFERRETIPSDTDKSMASTMQKLALDDKKVN